MPVYEYVCHDCRLKFESVRAISKIDDPLPCPECGKNAERIMATSFFAFTMRDGYPRGIPDKGQAYGKIGPYTTYATPEQKAKAAREDRAHESDYTVFERKEKSYQKKWEAPITTKPKTDS